jgi:P27 family predicted phage terminase small subunit
MPKTKIPAPDPLPVPPHLSEAAAQIWRETASHMAANGTVDAAYGPTLESYIAAVIRQRRIAAEIEAAPLTDEEGKVSPLLRIAGSTAATVRSLAAVLGLNPIARQRLPKAPQSNGGGRWSDL